VFRFCANAVAFSRRNLNIGRFGYPQRSWTQFPKDARDGCTYLIQHCPSTSSLVLLKYKMKLLKKILKTKT
jgi:hypothetical protein